MRKRQVAISFAIFIFVVAIGGRYGSGLLIVAIQHPPGDRLSLQTELVYACMGVGDSGTIDLTEIVDGDWDEVHLFGGYTSYETVAQELGFQWTPQSQFDRALGLANYVDESDQLLVFTRGQSVVAWAVVDTYARPGVQFEGALRLLYRAEARLVVEEGPGSSSHRRSWILRPAVA